MKLKCDFEIVDLGEEKVAVPVGEGADNLHGVVKLNKQGYEIFKGLQDGKDKSEIIKDMYKTYDTDIQTITNYVDEFMSELVSISIVG